MPKTIRNVYEQAISFEKLLMAHKKARRGKREKKDIKQMMLFRRGYLMNIFEILREEHDNISKFVDKFEAMAIDLMEKNEISIEEYTKAIEFIRVYADKTHHQKEEELLFKAMLETKDEMANNLVNHGMIVEHNLARLYVWELENALKAYQKEPTVKLKLAIVTNTMSYVYLLRRHIDKENRVAYPYGERLLSKEVIEKLNEQAQNYMK